jgi:heme/copper-type cytochrome/quinol oxidase subunit 2
MENNDTNKIAEILLSSIVIIVLCFAVFIVIISLNTANNNSGTILLSSNSTEEITTIGTTSLSVPNNAVCSVSSVTDLTGVTADPTKYTISNCVVTYNP